MGGVSRQLENIKKLCELERIHLVVADESSEWRQAGNLDKRGRSQYQLANQFLNCGLACNNMLNGRLHFCARSASLVELGVLDKSEVHVDLLNNDHLRSDLLHFLYDNTRYLQACDYCDLGTSSAVLIPKAIQVDKKN